MLGHVKAPYSAYKQWKCQADELFLALYNVYVNETELVANSTTYENEQYQWHIEYVLFAKLSKIKIVLPKEGLKQETKNFKSLAQIKLQIHCQP